MAEPYTSELRAELLEHLERIAMRDYVGVNEGFWICSDAAHEIRALRARVKALEEGVKEAEHWNECFRKDWHDLVEAFDVQFDAPPAVINSIQVKFINAIWPFWEWLRHIEATRSRRLEDGEYVSFSRAPNMGDLRGLCRAAKLMESE